MLLDIVEAPPPVLSYFCQYHYLQNVPLADTANVAVFIASRHSVQKFYVGNDVVCDVCCHVVLYPLVIVSSILPNGVITVTRPSHEAIT